MEKQGASFSSTKHKQPVSEPHLQELDQMISWCLSNIDVKFGFLKLGSHCNASEINAFTLARCHIENIKNKHKKHYSLDFNRLFDPGIKFLEECSLQSPILESSKNEAIEKLKKFFKEKGRFMHRCNV